MRNTVEIKKWMLDEGLYVAQIQRNLGFKAHSLVSDTIAGRKDNRKVLRFLLDRGCPVELLALPEDMKEAA